METVLSQMNSVHIFTPYFFEVYLIISLPRILLYCVVCSLEIFQPIRSVHPELHRLLKLVHSL
jgi:hypothetical protein